MAKEESGHGHGTKLGFWAIVALAFFGITGGPYSNEPVIQSLGLGLTWLAQLAVLVFHGFPLSLCCLEQTMLIPVNGGPLIWSRASMGPFAAHVVGVTGFFSYITQVGYLGTISLSYIEEMFPIFFENHLWVRHVSVASCIIICSVVDVGKLGRFLEVILILSLLPAFALVAIGLWNTPSLEWFSGFFALPERIDLFNGFMQLYWMNSGIANIMVRVEDAESPRVFRRAVLLNVVLASLAYVVPMWGGQLVDGSTDFSQWHSGYFHTIAATHLSPWFSWWIVSGAVLGSVGLLIAQVLVTVEFCCVCAELGSLPRFLLSRDGSHSAARCGLMVTFVGIILAILYRSDQLVQYVGVSYALFIATHFVTFYKLRFMFLDCLRPFRVGVEDPFSLKLLATIPVLFIVAPLAGAPQSVFIVTSVFIVCGILCFPFTAEFTSWRQSFAAIFDKRPFSIQPGLLMRNCLVPVEFLNVNENVLLQEKYITCPSSRDGEKNIEFTLKNDPRKVNVNHNEDSNFIDLLSSRSRAHHLIPVNFSFGNARQMKLTSSSSSKKQGSKSAPLLQGNPFFPCRTSPEFPEGEQPTIVSPDGHLVSAPPLLVRDENTFLKNDRKSNSSISEIPLLSTEQLDDAADNFDKNTANEFVNGPTKSAYPQTNILGGSTVNSFNESPAIEDDFAQESREIPADAIEQRQISENRLCSFVTRALNEDNGFRCLVHLDQWIVEGYLH